MLLVWASAPKVAESLGGRELSELREDLAAEMRKTLALFDVGLPEALAGVRAAHPLYGCNRCNNVAQVVRLMAAHEQRHQDPLRTILKNG